MTEIGDRASLEQLLKTQPREVSQAIAARAAMRVLPMLRGIPKEWKERGETRSRAALLPPLFYGVAMPWFISLGDCQESCVRGRFRFIE